MSIAQNIKILIEYLVLIFLESYIFPKRKTTNKSILFINSGRMGDLIISSIILENPNIFIKYDEVKFVIKKQYLELFADYDGKIEFIGFDYKKYKFSIYSKYKFIRYLHSFGFEKCFNLTSARGILNDEITLLSGANEKYCLNDNFTYLGEYFGKRLNKKYSQVLFTNINNEYEKHHKLLKYLNNNKKNTIIRFYNKFTFKTYDVDLLKDFRYQKDLIVIAPISSERNRDWPKSYFAELVMLLKDKFHIVLLGESDQASDLKKLKANNNNIIVLAGELSLNNIPLILSKTKLFIGLDSGITHMALKLGLPLVAIIGGGQFQRFFPFKESNKVKYLYYKMDCFGCEWKCELERKYCVEDISVNEIYDIVIEMLKE